MSQLQVTQAAAGFKPAKTMPVPVIESWDDLTGVAPSQEYPASETLFEQGSPVNNIYLIGRGLVKLIRLNESGQEMIVGLRSIGSALGSASAIVQMPHPVTAVTLTRCSLLRIPPETFFELARNNTRFCWHLHMVHSKEVYDLADQLMNIKYLSARRRLEQLLRQLIFAMDLSEQHKPVRLLLPLKHWEMAQLIGITPEHLSRVLKQIQSEGIMQRDNGSLIVFDPQKLFHPESF